MISEQLFGRTGVLLVNIGSPDAPTKKALRPYLKEFLSDKRVIDLPRWKWLPILHLIILNIRPKRSAALYKKIWCEEGSPLIVLTERQVAALSDDFASRGLGQIHFDYAMRYGNPSIPSKLKTMQQKGVERLLVLPMYPQYSGPTTASVYDGVAQALEKMRFLPELRFIRNWHDDPEYIKILANSVRTHFNKFRRPQKLLISFHGVPKRFLEEGDPYFCHCHKTARLMVEDLQLSPEEYQIVFQSHFGNEVWLQPYADETIAQLPKQGIKNVAVISPAFTTDCLETLEEIAIRNRELFLKHGGEQYEFIPCLNDTPEHIALLSRLIRRHGQGWEAFDHPTDDTTDTQNAQVQAMQLRQIWEVHNNIARLSPNATSTEETNINETKKATFA